MTTEQEIIGDHYEGFESARRLHGLLGQFDTFKEVKAHVGKEIADEAFRRRPCVRTLRYVGEDTGLDVDCPKDSCFFVKGCLYTSTDFNGATYTIVGYEEGRRVIGFACFEWVKNGV